MEPIPTIGDKDGQRFTLEILPSARCTFGDRDVLFLELAQSKDRTIILTIERLGAPSDEKPYARLDLTERKITNTPFNFKLPNTLSETIAGIYICRDSAKDGKCSGKLFMDMNTILRGYQPGKPRSDQPIDKIYYFQPLIITGNKPYVATRGFLPRGRMALQEALRVNSTNTHASQVEKLLSILASEPIRILSGNAVVDLPGYDQTKCRGK